MARPINYALAALLGATGACGGTSVTPATPQDGVGEGAQRPSRHTKKASARELLGISGPDTPWSEMSPDEREWYMVGKFLPITEEMFQDFDSAKFGAFSCDSCHGPDAKAHRFAMPSATLPAIPPAGTASYAALRKKHPRDMQFMELDVTPTSAILLGKKVSPDEKEGNFGCWSCHPGAD